MSNGQVLIDDNQKPVNGLYDATGHQAVNWQAGPVLTDSTTNQKYAPAAVDVTVTASQLTSATATLTNVAGSATSVSILTSNTARKGMAVYNDSSSAMYLAYASSSSTTTYTVKIPANNLFEMPVTPVYTGAMSALWDTATGNARITELS